MVLCFSNSAVEQQYLVSRSRKVPAFDWWIQVVGAVHTAVHLTKIQHLQLIPGELTYFQCKVAWHVMMLAIVYSCRGFYLRWREVLLGVEWVLNYVAFTLGHRTILAALEPDDLSGFLVVGVLLGHQMSALAVFPLWYRIRFRFAMLLHAAHACVALFANSLMFHIIFHKFGGYLEQGVQPVNLVASRVVPFWPQPSGQMMYQVVIIFLQLSIFVVALWSLYGAEYRDRQRFVVAARVPPAHAHLKVPVEMGLLVYLGMLLLISTGLAGMDAQLIADAVGTGPISGLNEGQPKPK